jgi:hypothetical protein
MHFFFSKYPLFDGIGDANFKGLRLMFFPNVPGAKFIPGVMFIPKSRVVLETLLLRTQFQRDQIVHCIT